MKFWYYWYFGALLAQALKMLTANMTYWTMLVSGFTPPPWEQG